MNIVLAVHHPACPDAGASGVTLALAEEYEKLGHTVSVWAMGKHSLPTELAVAHTLAYRALVAARLLTGRPQGIDVIDAATGDLGMLPRRFVARSAQLFVTRSHGLEAIEDRVLRSAAQAGEVDLSWKYALYHGGINLRLVDRSLRLADAAFLLNDNETAYCLEELRLPSERIFLIRNGLPRYLLTAPGPAFDPSRRSLAFIGSWIPRKGVAVVAKVFDQLLADDSNLHVSILGTHTDSATVLSSFSPAHRRRVRVVREYRRSDLRTLLEGHSLLLAPSVSEGFGMAIIEGMACGLAVVASDVGGPRSILQHQRAGVLVPPDDATAFAETIRGLLRRPRDLADMQEAARKLAQDYSWERLAQQQLAIYESMLANKRLRLSCPT